MILRDLKIPKATLSFITYPTRFDCRETERALKGQVTAQVVELDLEVPFLFRPFQSVAVKIVDDEVRAWIDRARPTNSGMTMWG